MSNCIEPAISHLPQNLDELKVFADLLTSDSDEIKNVNCLLILKVNAFIKIICFCATGGPMRLEPFGNRSHEGVFAASHNGEWYYFTAGVSGHTARALCSMLGYGYVKSL